MDYHSAFKNLDNNLRKLYEPYLEVLHEAWNGGWIANIFTPWAIEGLKTAHPGLAEFLSYISPFYLESYNRLRGHYPPIPKAFPKRFTFRHDIESFRGPLFWGTSLGVTLFNYIGANEKDPFKALHCLLDIWRESLTSLWHLKPSLFSYVPPSPDFSTNREAESKALGLVGCFLAGWLNDVVARSKEGEMGDSREFVVPIYRFEEERAVPTSYPLRFCFSQLPRDIEPSNKPIVTLQVFKVEVWWDISNALKAASPTWESFCDYVDLLLTLCSLSSSKEKEEDKVEPKDLASIVKDYPIECFGAIVPPQPKPIFGEPEPKKPVTSFPPTAEVEPDIIMEPVDALDSPQPIKPQVVQPIKPHEPKLVDEPELGSARPSIPKAGSVKPLVGSVKPLVGSVKPSIPKVGGKDPFVSVESFFNELYKVPEVQTFVNKTGIQNQTPNNGLEQAAKNGDLNLVHFFIEKGAKNWNRGMRCAAEGGHKDLVHFFIEKGAKYWDRGMYGAAIGGHKDLVHFFIEKGANNWNRGMRGAAEGGHKDLVHFFIEKGANAWDWAIRWAAEGGHNDLVHFFIEKGAKNWNYGMLGAAEGGHKDLVNFFIEKGANWWDGGMAGAAFGGHKDLVLFFIEKGAKNWNGGMARAAVGGHKDLVHFFIEKGAYHWNWGMEGAARGGHNDLVEFFKQKIEESHY